MGAEHRQEVDVTQEMIDRACTADTSHCMIAEAIRVSFPAMTSITVDLATIRFSDRKKGLRYTYLTPRKCQEQLLRFDQGTHCLAWKFRLPSRPAHIGKIIAKKSSPNSLGRPTKAGSAKPLEFAESINYRPTLRDGRPPRIAVLSNAKGQRRVFGVKSARGFDPHEEG